MIVINLKSEKQNNTLSVSLILIICSQLFLLTSTLKKRLITTDEITQWYLPFSYTISLDKSRNTYFLDRNNYSKNTNPIQLYSVFLLTFTLKGWGKKKGQGCSFVIVGVVVGVVKINKLPKWMAKKNNGKSKLAYWFLENYGTYLIKEIDKKLEARNSKRNTSSPKDWKIKITIMGYLQVKNSGKVKKK